MKHQKQVLTAESTESTEMKNNIKEITDVISQGT